MGAWHISAALDPWPASSMFCGALILRIQWGRLTLLCSQVCMLQPQAFSQVYCL